MEEALTDDEKLELRRFSESDKALAYVVHVWLKDNQRARASQHVYQKICASRILKRSALSWKRKVENYVACATGNGPTGGADKVEFPLLLSKYQNNEAAARKDALMEASFPNPEIREFYAGIGFDINSLPKVEPMPEFITDFGVVTKSGVLRAAKSIDKSGVPKGFDDSIDYDVVIDSRRYPPKAIIGIAYSESTGIPITGSRFKGGEGTPCFKKLIGLGFEIVDKSHSLKKNEFFNGQKILAPIASKPFTILAGGTGTGKTRAAKLVASSIAGRDNVEVVAVGADWTDNRPLLGFRNLLAEGGKTYVAPPALRIILKALGNPGKPHFLILDEMNLSHVERYFADFLSSMESKEPLKLHDSAEDLKTEDGVLVKGKVDWPGNLFVIGTVNIDETTYMFSPKVLDRAHVIEFKVPWKEIKAGLDDAVPGEVTQLTEAQVAEFMRVAGLKDKTLNDDEHAALVEVLRDMHEALDGTRFVFAHRTARECLNFIVSAKALAAAGIVPAQDTKALIDMAILQKALPKLNGAAGTLSKVLDDLIKVADSHDLDQCKAKLDSMSRQLKADQFVSFIN